MKNGFFGGVCQSLDKQLQRTLTSSQSGQCF
jgi:hypothetical protein